MAGHAILTKMEFVGVAVIPAKAGIQSKNGCPPKNLGHDG
jgi:hypothetical protein